MNRFQKDVLDLVGRNAQDLHDILTKRVLIIGGSGFVGRWLTEPLVLFAQENGLKNCLTSISRRIANWQLPYIKAGDLEVLTQDVRNGLEIQSTYGYVFHGATPASASLNSERPNEMYDTIVRTAQAVAHRLSSSNARIVNLSSGAVYGQVPPDVLFVDESWTSNPKLQFTDSAYHRGKFEAEQLFSEKSPNIDVVHARLFTFVGPHLPLDTHFAVGNFVRDAVSNSPIQITGDGRTLRSYMYGNDLVEWLVAVAKRGLQNEAYNIGSNVPVSLRQLAELVQQATNTTIPIIDHCKFQAEQPAHRYIPSTKKSESQLGLSISVQLVEAVSRTLEWARETANN
jgi:nucleoside-diphosphate-sugar epimerase